MGFDTRWAGDGTAALAFVESDPELALVLSDVVMPGGVSGLDLARTLRDRRPHQVAGVRNGLRRIAAASATCRARIFDFGWRAA